MEARREAEVDQLRRHSKAAKAQLAEARAEKPSVANDEPILGAIGLEVVAALPALHRSWRPVTVVHRDLYEEQVLLGRRVGLIDLDDAGLGPPELDIGNLLAHLDLLELGAERPLDRALQALLDGYTAVRRLDEELLERCRVLARLGLARIHEEARLLPAAVASGWA
jgi:Ser/Thr protein kinase RdoA (MazF antagonist)